MVFARCAPHRHIGNKEISRSVAIMCQGAAIRSTTAEVQWMQSLPNFAMQELPGDAHDTGVLRDKHASRHQA